MRHRERESGELGANVEVEYTSGYSGCTVTATQTDTHTQTVFGRNESIDDVVVPDYYERIERGEVINNPCVYQSEEESSDTGGHLVKIHRDGCPMGTKWLRYTGHMATMILRKSSVNLLPVAPAVEASEQMAKLRALANVDSTPYGFLEDVFEIRETLRFLRKPAASIVNLARDFVRKRNAAVPLGAKAVADVYLAYRFAVTPLLRSCQDGAEAIQLGVRSAKREKRRTARGFSHDSSEVLPSAGSVVLSWTYFQPKHTVEYNRESISTDKVSAGILYEVTNPVVNHRFYLGLRAKDVPEAVWAVVPWSFMIDRAIDISSSIRGLTNLSDPSVKILTAWSVRRSLTERSLTTTGCTPTDWREQISDFSSSKSQVSEFRYVRDVWSPSIVDAIPPLNLKGLVDDATKIADALALAAQLFGK